MVHRNEFVPAVGTVPLLGFGCMRFIQQEDGGWDGADVQRLFDYAMAQGVNYFDMGYGYLEGQCEDFCGKLLKKYPRNSFLMADKLPIWQVDSVQKPYELFEEQLRRLGTDTIDCYLVHAVNRDRLNIFEQYQVGEFLAKIKEEGRVKAVGFSFHDTPEVLEKALDAAPWDFAQLQLNWFDWEVQRSKEQYAMLEARGIPCIVMEPLRGGSLIRLPADVKAVLAEYGDLTPAQWALGWLKSLKNVKIILSGMNTLGQLEENTRILATGEPLTARQMEGIETARQMLLAKDLIPCTACRYCMPCPMGVAIPDVFSVHNTVKLLGDYDEPLRRYFDFFPPETHGNRCVACGQCLPQCPQNIDIPTLVQQCHQQLAAIRQEKLSAEA